MNDEIKMTKVMTFDSLDINSSIGLMDEFVCSSCKFLRINKAFSIIDEEYKIIRVALLIMESFEFDNVIPSKLTISDFKHGKHLLRFGDLANDDIVNKSKYKRFYEFMKFVSPCFSNAKDSSTHLQFEIPYQLNAKTSENINGFGRQIDGSLKLYNDTNPFKIIGIEF